MSEQSEHVEHQESQRQASRRATFETLKGKKPVELEFTATINGEEVSFLFVSVGRKDYDKLVTDCPPTTEQIAQGASFDQDRFGPKLLSRVCREPELSEEQWGDIWTDPNWGRGEVLELFSKAVNVCSRGLSPAPFGVG